MAEMAVTVSMTAEEFLEFMAWKKDREQYTKEMAARSGKWEIMAKKVTWPSRKIRNGPERSRSWTRNTRRNCWNWPANT